MRGRGLSQTVRNKTVRRSKVRRSGGPRAATHSPLTNVCMEPVMRGYVSDGGSRSHTLAQHGEDVDSTCHVTCCIEKKKRSMAMSSSVLECVIVGSFETNPALVSALAAAVC